MKARQQDALIQRLVHLSKIAVPGTLAEVFLPCGNPSCHCHEDREKRHGPHLYLKYRSLKGHSTGIYVPRWAEDEVREATMAWSERREVIVQLGDLNREATRARIKAKRKGE